MSDIELTLKQATDVLEEARKPRESLDNEAVYPGVMPESDDQRVQIATELVGFAVDAYVNDGNHGDEVVDVLIAAGLTITDEGELILGGESQGSSNGNGASAEAAPAAADTVTLIGPDGTEGEYPAAAAEALLAAGFTRPAEPEPEPEAAATSEPADDDIVLVKIGDVNAEMPYASAKNLIASGAAELIEYDLGDAVPDDASAEDPDATDTATPPEDDDPYAGEELQEPWEGYNNTSDVDIRRQMETFTDEEIAYVKAYEARHKKRQRIGNFKRKGPAPDRSAQTEEGPAADGHAELDQQADEAVARDAGDPTEHGLARGYTPEPEQHEHMPILTAHDERRLALAEVEKSHLPVPADELPAPPEFPEDIAAVDDATLASLHSKFNACLALAIWKHGLVQVDERAFKHIADHHAREARKTLDPNNPATGKPKGRELLDREAEDDETVQAWREKQYNAEIRAIPMRKLIDIYSGYVEVLSRQWTFREREHDSSGGLAKRA